MWNNVDLKSDQPCELSHQFIKKITNDYDQQLIVGNGAFGTVFKGICENGEEVAVKVLKNMTGIDNKEFHKEFENLRRLKHQNVVQLLGFCNEAEKVLVENTGNQLIADEMHTALIFEYVRNGSLDNHMSADGCSGLNWHKQYTIIKGICQGLEYLRHGLERSVWHLDLKPGNILLDNNMIPKIADFGLSRLLGNDKSRKTINNVGTIGYLPREYIDYGLISEQFDIYSLGVIIAKLMAGCEGYFDIDDMGEKGFVKHVHNNWRKRLRATLAARPLEVYCEQVRTCINIAVKCMNRRRQERPTIQSIVSDLIETEIMIGNLRLETELFLDEEHNLPEGGIQDRTPNMASESSRCKSIDGRAKLKEVPLQLLKRITNDFSVERILSSGGSVYKGILEDGEVVAVKKLQENTLVADDKAFIKEVTSVAALIKHENALQLVGFCHGKKKKLVPSDNKFITAEVTQSSLCYEHLPTGSLERNLFEVPTKMDWETRFKIIKGVCNGLLFLHSTSIVHMDLNPGNILLDNNMRPKIADFALSRLFCHEATRLCTQTVVGSYGYMAPEYLYRGEISTRSDIYSLGMLIIEITAEEKNLSRKEKQPSGRTFIDNVRKTWTREHIASLYSSSPPQHLHEVEACIEIGLKCTSIDRRSRPSIEEIVETLNGLPQIGCDGLLSLQSRRVNFPMEPRRLTSSSVYLVNNTDALIAFRLATELPRRYLTKLPFCGIVPPKCANTFTLITREQKKPPPSNSDDCLILQSRTAHNENMDNVYPANYAALFLDTAADEVQEAKIVVACETETIPDQIIDGQNYREVLSIDVHPTEPWILTSNQRGYVCIWNYQTQAEEGSIEVTREPVHSAKFIGREEWFVVGSGDGYIYVCDYNTMEEVVDMIEAHDGHRIMCLAVSPTQPFVLSASDDHTIKLWDWAKEWQCTRTFEGHYDTVTRVMFDPRNNESFASASMDHTVKIWNIHSATCNITWDGHPDGLLCVHYFPRYFQQFLISGSSDGAAKIWDLETDTCVDTLQDHAKGISALCWHPELRVLVTGSLDGTARIWNWKYASSTYRLENIIGFNLGAVNALGYLNGSTRIVVGCHQGIALMEVNELTA
ncbi:hypothetical protein CFC21_044744 [Triticum aestivum]|uniref:Protein kinase domain-containing protein n=3 Tax=Triticum aestivum TaxID=4565 RepID=A0A3B6FY94_WHEAT|nr:uncharacterized protein LOC123072698 isoform X2 [Triticum aestivum]XP_044352237.1 uncharacterized protein LOC123072698 isoform X2 [Triticum aestivum]XP_044352238.1 uncharacterized protein LOC123072698 isoform X2 [Triticum aestivum]XP_044352239.1 uncharacterized protein LOC123072698 isoform X2 [Triticum aestivum]XP_044352240.1 uncharacterized protein LOC123072698 isoform X2 [Triticum aestivum]XP_044352241.1 uncharacterized protein LOC123072698 isoform X2 [Triticum aestivum]KAF7033658.1 hypo